MSTSATPPIKLLNPDVLREIFLRLSKYELLDVTCVCREWNHVAQRLIDQTLVLVVSSKMQDANLHLMGRLQQDSDLRHRVKDLVIKEWYLDALPAMPMVNGQIEDPWKPGRYFSTTYTDDNPMSSESKELITQLCQAFALMDLSSFTWSAFMPIPLTLIEALATRPSCNVHVRHNERAYDVAVCSYSPTVNHVQIQNLAQICSQLTTLELFLPPEDALILSAVGKLIASSSRLKRLKLYALGKLYGGFKVHIVPTRPARGTVFTPVRTMGWIQEPLLWAERRLQLEDLELDNFCVCGIEAFNLNTIIEVSGLRRLGLSCFSFLSEHLPSNLRSFRLHCHSSAAHGEDQYCRELWAASEVREMLSQCSHLDGLELLDGAEILDRPLLKLIGPRLTRLSLRRVVWPDLGSGYDLDLVSKACPKLRALAIDIPDEQLFSRFCSELSTSFPSLVELSIRRGSEVHLIVDFFTPDPNLHTTTISDLSSIWDKMAEKRSRLVEFNLHYDFWKPWDRDRSFFSTGMPYDAQAEIERSTFVVRDDHGMKRSRATPRVLCLEVEEARRAIEHQWQWLDGYLKRYGSWRQRLLDLEEKVIDGQDLVRRRTPNEQGEFWQRAMY